MTRRPLVAALAAALLVPLAYAGDWHAPLASTRKLSVRARAVGRDSSDQALAALYDRLFKLQDVRRDAELRIEGAELVIGDLAKEYREHDSWVDTPAELRELADNPRHPRYPNITESKKLALLAETRKQARVQVLAKLEIEKLERDIEDVKRLIKEHLSRPAAAAASR